VLRVCALGSTCTWQAWLSLKDDLQALRKGMMEQLLRVVGNIDQPMSRCNYSFVVLCCVVAVTYRLSPVMAGGRQTLTSSAAAAGTQSLPWHSDCLPPAPVPWHPFGCCCSVNQSMEAKSAAAGPLQGSLWLPALMLQVRHGVQPSLCIGDCHHLWLWLPLACLSTPFVWTSHAKLLTRRARACGLQCRL